MNFEYDGHSTNTVTQDNVFELTKVSVNGWNGLTGLFSSHLPANFANELDFEISGELPVVIVKGSNKNFEIDIRCDLSQKEIYVFFFKIKDHRKMGLGLTIFKEFIKRASKIGFETVRCNASSKLDEKEDKKFAGYNVWGKFGFTMTPEAHLVFVNKMNREGRTESCLQKLHYTKHGQKYWEEYGESWSAYFDLSEGSLNRRLLKKYEGLKLSRTLF